jgi:hypothetical protein
VKIIFLFAALFAAPHDYKCKDSDGGIEKRMKGQITYQIGDPMCFTNVEKGQPVKQCSTMAVVDLDACKDKLELTEQYCDPDTGQPSRKQITCKCLDGACVKD